MKKSKVGQPLPAPGLVQDTPDPLAPASALAKAPTLNLADHFLIAMPSMQDPVFGGTVVYVCEHNENGVLGVVINKPTDMTMQTLFERIDRAPSSTRRSCSAAPCRTTAASCSIRRAPAIRRR